MPPIPATVTSVRTQRDCGFNKASKDRVTLWNKDGLEVTITVPVETLTEGERVDLKLSPVRKK